MHTSIGLRWLAISAFVACGDPVALTTGLDGFVYRGPVAPVCQVNEPCEAPFAASFEVRLGSRGVATFHSDSAGHFTVHLAPGTYVIVPAANAPLMNPTGQTRVVDVTATGLTPARLQFDTGIR